MRSNTGMRHWGLAAITAAAALGWSGAQAQSGDPHGNRVETVNAPQVREILKNAKHSLSASVLAAEKHSGGRAVRAECCSAKNGTAGDGLCRVTLLVGEDRLVEATMNLQTGAVVSQRDVTGLEYFAAYDATIDPDFAPARSWQKATDLMAKKVTNGQRQDLGKIEEIVVDAGSGRILYGVLSYGGLFGMGDKLFAVPWRALPLSGDAGAFVLNVDQDRLKNATSFDKQQWPDLADEQFSTSTFKYYDQTPYWHKPAAADGGRATSDYRARWNQRPSVWQKAGDLVGKEVRNAQNDELGQISDLAIDPHAGRILYGILSAKGKLYAVPWPALELSPDFKQLVLNVKPEQLKDNMSFGQDNWPDLVDTRWADETHAYYGVQPYWSGVRAERAAATP